MVPHFAAERKFACTICVHYRRDPASDAAAMSVKSCKEVQTQRSAIEVTAPMPPIPFRLGLTHADPFRDFARGMEGLAGSCRLSGADARENTHIRAFLPLRRSSIGRAWRGPWAVFACGRGFGGRKACRTFFQRLAARGVTDQVTVLREVTISKAPLLTRRTGRAATCFGCYHRVPRLFSCPQASRSRQG